MKRQWLLTLFVLGWLFATAGHAMPPRENVVVTQSELDEQVRLGINVTRTPVRDAGMRGMSLRGRLRAGALPSLRMGDRGRIPTGRLVEKTQGEEEWI